MAASSKGYQEIVKLLCDKGVNPDIRAKDGFTAIALACQEGYVNIVKQLLDKGAKSDIGSKDGITPVMLASQNGHSAVVKLLLSKVQILISDTRMVLHR